MSSGERVLDLLLRIKSDQQAQQKTVRDLNQVEALLSKTARQTLTVEKAAEGLNKELAEIARARAIEILAQDAAQAGVTTGNWADALRYASEQLSLLGAGEDEIRGVARALADAEVQAERTAREIARVPVGRDRNELARQGVGDLSTLSSAGASILGRSSGVGGALGTVADVTGFAEYLPLAGAALGALTPQMVAMTAAGAALAGVFATLTENTRRQREVTERAIEVQATYAEAIVTGTRESIQAQLLEIDAQNQIASLRLQALEQQGLVFNNYLESFLYTIAPALGDMGVVGGSADAVADSIRQLQEQMVRNDEIAQVLTIALANTEDVTRSAADAENKLYDARLQSIREGADAIVAQAQQLLELDKMTAEQRQTEVAALQRQIEILTRERNELAYANTAEASFARTTLDEQINRLTFRMTLLSEATDTYADQLDRANKEEETRRKALETQTENYLKALEEEGEIRTKIADLVVRENEARAEYADLIEQLDVEEGERRTDVLAKAAETRTQIEEDTADRLLEIQNRFTKDYRNAVGERDALAAKRAADDFIEQDAKERKEQDKRLRRIEDDLSKELQQIERYYDKREQEAYERLTRELTTIQQASVALQNSLINNQNAQLQIAQYGSNGLLQIEQNFWNQRLAMAQNYASYNAYNTPANYVTPNYVTMTAAQARQALGLDAYVDRRFDIRMGDYLNYNTRGR